MAQPSTTVEETLGIELVELREDYASGRLEVTDRVRQAVGIVHGGVLATLAESLASHATHRAVSGDGMLALGQSNQTTFLRPIAEGTIDARAHRRHAGKTTWIWDVDITDADGKLCAVSRITVAIRPATGT